MAEQEYITASSKQLELLKKNFPQCFDKQGAFMPQKLQDLVTQGGAELSNESYGLNWLGKSYARLLANERPRTLLSEDKAHNAQPEHQNSENLLIKGDNLEVLKHLVNAYSEQVKMIYIDPPYNTGSDGFVYQDDRKFTPQRLSELAGVDRDEAKRILSFTQSKANSHSAWLTFMYPRLYVARELLKDDGVIFISIDDNEVAQLKMLCDEVFGEQNFIGDLTWEKKKKGTFLSNNLTNIKESILVYCKSLESFNGLIGEVNSSKETYPCINASNKREKRTVFKGIKSKFRESNYFLSRGSEISETTMSLVLHSDLVIENNTLVKDVVIEANWRYTQENMNRYASEGNLYVTQDLYIRRIVTDARHKTLKDLLLREGTDKSLKYESFNSNNLFEDGWGSNEDAEEEVRLLMDKVAIFSNPKPSKLIKKLITSVRDEKMMVLDFFAGSGTTAHAVMQLNAEDSGNRRCISVQIDEATDKKSEAYKAGYKSIFGITKARIEKAAVKIKEENPDYKGDLGFKIFETKPLADDYMADMPLLSSEQQDLALMSGDVNDTLTTWQVFDGIALTQTLAELSLADYTAYQHDNVCYFMHKGFSSAALLVFLQKLDDTTDTFAVEKLVVNGVNFDSKYQREIAEAMSQYQNKKDKHIRVEFRY